MGVELFAQCRGCDEAVWLGSLKPHLGDGFQFGEHRTLSWLLRHTAPACEVELSRDDLHPIVSAAPVPDAGGPPAPVIFVCEACEDHARFSPGAGRAVVDWLAQHVGPAHTLRVVRAQR